MSSAATGSNVGDSPSAHAHNYHKAKQYKRQNAQDWAFSADMPLHSFEAPLSLDQIENHWLTSGSTTTTDDRVILNPDIINRFGLFWHREPVVSQKFIMETNVKVKGTMADGQGFGIWYVKENLSENYHPEDMWSAKTWNEGMEKAGLTLFGYRNTVSSSSANPSSAIGVVFTKSNSIYCLSGSDTKTYNSNALEQDLGYNKRFYKTGINYLNVDFKVKLERNSDTIKVLYTSEYQNEPIEICSMQSDTSSEASALQDSYFVGFSSYSGQGGNAAEVAISSLKMTNKDEHHIGEHFADEDRYGDSITELLKDDHKYKTDDTQKKALLNLNKLLEKYVEISADTKLLEQLQFLSNRMSDLEHNAKQFTSEIRHSLKAANGNLDHHDVHVVRKELGGLAKLLHSHSHRHHEDIDEVRKKANYLPTTLSSSGSEAASSLTGPMLEQFVYSKQELQRAANSVDTMFYMFVFILFTLTVMLSAIWKKMQNYERKHFL